MRDFVDWLGTGVVGVMGIAVKVVAELANAFSGLVAIMKGLGYGLNTIYETYRTKGLSGLTGEGISNAFSKGFDLANQERRDAERSAYAREAQRQREAAKLKSDQEYTKIAEERLAKQAEEQAKKDAKTLADGNAPTVNVNNNIQVITEADPDRIAISLDKMNASSINDALRAIEGIPGF